MTGVISLVKQTVTVDALRMESVTETERSVMCEIDSVTQTEFFAAQNSDLKPEYRFTVFFADYEGEEIVKYGGERYGIYRTYRAGDYMELYAERKAGRE